MMATDKMTPEQFKKAKQKLGLSYDQIAILLGYNGKRRVAQVMRMVIGERTIRPAQALLIQAYLDGYRPIGWPATKEGE